MLRNGLGQYGQAGLGNASIFLLPWPIIEQVIVEAAEAQPLAAEDIPRFHTVAQEPIDQKLIAVWAQALVALGIGRIQIPFQGLPDTADRALLYWIVAQRFALPPSRDEKVDGVEQRMAGGGCGELDGQEHRTQMPLELGRQGSDVLPLKGGFVEVGRAG